MKTCENCATENDESSTICSFCGNSLEPKKGTSVSQRSKKRSSRNSWAGHTELFPGESVVASFDSSFNFASMVHKNLRKYLFATLLLPLALALLFAFLNFQSDKNLGAVFGSVIGAVSYLTIMFLFAVFSPGRLRINSHLDISNKRIIISSWGKRARAMSYSIPLSEITRVRLISHESPRIKYLMLRVYSREYEQFLRDFVAKEGPEYIADDPLDFTGEGSRLSVMKRFGQASLNARNNGMKFGVINMDPFEGRRAKSTIEGLLESASSTHHV